MIRVAIVEDDPQCAEQLRGYVERWQRERKETCETVPFSDGLEIVECYRPIYDVILMDIEMPHLGGMEAARRIRKLDDSVILIFITNMAKYAIAGYEVGALDFVLKPVSYFAFSLKMDKAAACLRSRQQESLMVSTEDGMQRLPVGDICYMEVVNHRLVIHTDQGSFVTGGSLREMEERLTQYGFARCNKGYLVNLSRITQVKSGSVVVGGDELLISRRRKDEFLSAVTDYYGRNWV